MRTCGQFSLISQLMDTNLFFWHTSKFYSRELKFQIGISVVPRIVSTLTMDSLISSLDLRLLSTMIITHVFMFLALGGFGDFPF